MTREPNIVTDEKMHRRALTGYYVLIDQLVHPIHSSIFSNKSSR